jgi:hypothetical protein
MPRNYSEKLLLDVYKEGQTELGKILALACVKNNLPAIYVAKVFGVSRMSIHSWFRGSDIRGKNRKKIEEFLDQIEQDVKAQILPALTLSAAKKYIESIINKE